MTKEPTKSEAQHFEQKAGKQHHVPYGSVTYLQRDGSWIAVQQFDLDGDRQELVRLITQALSSIQSLNSDSLATYHSFDSNLLRVVWKINGKAPLRPLSSAPVPCSTRFGVKLVQKLADAITNLHSIGLAAYDFNPAIILASADFEEVVLISTPWLAEHARRVPNEYRETPFVAPELFSSTAKVDAVRADVFGLGSLVQHLIIGDGSCLLTGQLPSELSTELQDWDVFVDGCRRKNPAGRFASVTEAMATLPTIKVCVPSASNDCLEPKRPAVFPSKSAAQARNFRQRNAVKWIVITLAVLFLVCFGWYGTVGPKFRIWDLVHCHIPKQGLSGC